MPGSCGEACNGSEPRFLLTLDCKTPAAHSLRRLQGQHVSSFPPVHSCLGDWPGLSSGSVGLTRQMMQGSGLQTCWAEAEATRVPVVGTAGREVKTPEPWGGAVGARGYEVSLDVQSCGPRVAPGT